MSYFLNFISQNDFENHVLKTVMEYNEILKSINLAKFNSNVIDPIKLTFDKSVMKKSWEEIINLEIHRQRDKSNTNAIGYFHQNMFKYIKNCEVPIHGFDVIYTKPNGNKIYVEMKNKHNTMNSASSQKTYIKLSTQVGIDQDCECYLVEILAPYSRNIVWELTVDGCHVSNKRVRRVSIDKFYEIVTGQADSFFNICKQLPITIDELIKNNRIRTQEKDTVLDELKQKNPDILKSLYLLAFETYNGFKNI